jgi:amino acid adenylation domain-containing protein
MNLESATSAFAEVDYDPFAEANLSRVVPTTEPQREVWLASQLSREGSLAYNESVSLALRGELDVSALRASVQQLVDRHEALRSTIGPEGQELCIADSVAIDVPLIDLSMLARPDRDAAHRERLLRAVDTLFDLQRGPLVRAEIVKLAADHHVLVLSAHHIVCDGWSFGVLVQELGALYTAQHALGEAAVPAADSFADYALAQSERGATREHAADEAFWLSRFSGSVPVLDLPLDRPRAATRSVRSVREDHWIDAVLVSQLRSASARAGASFFSALLGSFAALLHRIAGTDDVVIGVPSAGQSVAGLHHLVGHCVNLLPLRIAVDPAQPMAPLIAGAQSVLLDAFEHPQYTFGTLLKKLAVARDPSRLPLVSVMFNLDQALDPNEAGFVGLQAEFAGNPRVCENFELFVNAVQTGGGLRLECQYSSDLFDAETVRRWLACYEALLRGVCERAQTPLAELPLASEADRALLSQWNDTRADFRRDAFVHTLIEEQARRTPRAVALKSRDAAPSYTELDERANRIAHALRGIGVREGALVGLHAERSADMVAAMLGVLKAGAAYVPLDPAYPAERLAYMVGDAQLAAMVSQQSLAGALPWPRERALWLDADQPLLAAQPCTAPVLNTARFSPESPAYVIYTSGSTGKPKGVCVPHRAVVNYLQAVARRPGLAEGDRLVAVTTLSFDIAVTELLLPLAVGAQIVLAGREQASDGQALRALIEANAAQVMQATPATWRMLIEAGWRGHRQFKALCGGEPLQADLADALLARCGTLWNMYGPTETTVWSTCCEITRPVGSITIGRPIANTSVWMLDERQQLCPIGVPGEIWIGGDGVTLGYLNRPELTDERFIADPFGWAPGARLYRTGDRGRWRNDGQIEHLGRTDFQVKVRGYRIELGEIEAALLAHAGVARAVVVTREDRPADVRLAAYLVAEPGRTLDGAALKAHLRATLPDYMVPQHFTTLPAIPLLPNGKVDRKALPAPDAAHRDAKALVAPRSDSERRVLAAMEAVLGMPGLSIDDDFFMLGGHSLLAAQLSARLGAEFEVAVPLRTLFEAPTTERLAAALDALRGQPASSTARVRVPARADQARAPLTVMQQRLWFLEELEPGRIAYNTPSAHRLRGILDIAAIERALQAVADRQPAFRTSIVREGSEAVQVVHEQVRLELPFEDLAVLPAEAREARLANRLQTLADRPFDLSVAPLVRAHLFRLADDEHVLFFMPHHIVWDGWSFDLFYGEISAFYAHEALGAPVSLPPLPVSYGDFAEWHATWLQGAEFQQQLEHWKRSFNGAIEVNPLPTDRPRRAGMSGKGATVWMKVDSATVGSLHDAGRSANATLFMTLLAAYCVVLHQASGERRLVIGTPVRGRSTPEVEHVMGFFTNLLLLQIDIDPADRFDDLLRRVRSAVLEAFTYPDVPMEQLMRALHVRRGEDGSSLLYHALFSFQDVHQRQRFWGPLAHERVPVFQSGATEDLGCWFIEDEQGLSGGFTYNCDLFRASTAQLLRERLLHVLAQLRLNPQARLSELLAIRDDERAVLDAPRSPRMGDGAGALVPVGTLLAGAAGEPLDAMALLARALAMRAALQAHVLPPEAPVAVLLPQSADRVAALLALWQSGRPALLLDPQSSAAWNEQALQATGALAVIATRADTLPWASRLPCLDPAGLPASAADMPDIVVQPGATAVIVAAPCEGGAPAMRLVRWSQAEMHDVVQVLREAGVRPGRRCVLHGVLGHDASLAALLALVAGGDVALQGGPALVLPPGDAPLFVAAPAGALSVLADATDALPTGARVLCLGEPMPFALAQRLHAAGAELWQGLGLLSAGHPIGAFGRVEVPDDHAAVGLPCAGWRAQVLLEDGRQAVIGRVGGLRLIDPLGRAFDTGAKARWSSAGRLEWRGQHDDAQVCSGATLTPAALAAALSGMPGVVEVAVTFADLSGVGRRAVVHAVLDAQHDRAATVQAMKTKLAAHLPAALVPRDVVLIEAMPHLANGEIDAARLAPLDAGAAHAGYVGPRNATERALVEIWGQLLDLSHVSVHDNFFEIGGHSLLAVQLFARIERRFGLSLPLSTLLRHSSCAALAALISPETAAERAPATAGDWNPLVMIRKGGARPPLFCIHALGGNVLNYRVLAGALSSEQPVYGLQAIGLDGLTRPLRSIPAMAARYCEEVRRVQPHGPYYLCGGSLGGTLAFEMAQQLVRSGEQVALLALFDTAGPTRRAQRRQAHEASASLKRWGRYLRRALTFTDAAPLLSALRLRMQGWMDRAVARWHWARSRPLPHDVRLRVLEAANWVAYDSYAEQAYPGRITLFRAVDEPGDMGGDADLGWDRVASGVQIIEMPGTHFDFIEQPELGHRLREELENAQRHQSGVSAPVRAG